MVRFTPRPLYHPRQRVKYPLNKRKGKGSESIWTFRNKEKSLAPTGNWTMILLPFSPKPVQSLDRLSHPGSNLTLQEGPKERVLLISETDIHFWCDFDRASSLICGDKLPTRCNRGFYCRSYCLFNMFRAPLCPSSGAQKYYTVVAACGISCCGFQVVGLVWSWGLCLVT